MKAPSHSTIVAYLALFVALGGSAYALGRGEVKTRHLANNAVKANKLAANSVAAPKIRAGAVRTKAIRNNAVTRRKLAPNVRAGLQGATGPQGPEGPPGPKGDSAATFDCNEGLAPDDVMVRVGPLCMDRYEASVWDAPTGGNQITGPLPCDADGQDCKGKIFARSVPGVAPRGDVTWFQAQQALASSGKRLPSNAEWQMAAAGTPDHPGPCNTDSAGLVDTGTAPACVSDHAVNDMVGNAEEWVADWSRKATCTSDWSFSDDYQGVCGPEVGVGDLAAWVRGGMFASGAAAGPFAISGLRAVIDPEGYIGFRGVR